MASVHGMRSGFYSSIENVMLTAVSRKPVRKRLLKGFRKAELRLATRYAEPVVAAFSINA